MPRFVVLEHDHPELHWDLMLDTGEHLRTWRLLQPPATSQTIDAIALGDHRRVYLDYEGPVSGNRGNVRCWDRGTYAIESETIDRIDFALEGSRYRGKAALQQVSGEDWQFKLITESEDEAGMIPLE